jgi:uridine phosphorylase
VSPDNTPEARAFDAAPILDHKHYAAPSVFTPESLLREARRQKALPTEPVPAICILDPDGDLVDYLRATQRSQRQAAWACYHSQLDIFAHAGIEYGVIGRVVGAPYAVLVAEELFASGCQLLISITSAGQIIPRGQPPYFILIDRALRDEGTSYHYLPPSPFCALRPELEELLRDTWDTGSAQMHSGASWTTDAPFRETEEMIAACRANGILAVEMEAAALYALAQAKQYAIVCFAHVTNQMAQQGDDFEKGPDQGSQAALRVIRHTAQYWLQRCAQTDEVHASEHDESMLHNTAAVAQLARLCDTAVEATAPLQTMGGQDAQTDLPGL